MPIVILGVDLGKISCSVVSVDATGAIAAPWAGLTTPKGTRQAQVIAIRLLRIRLYFNASRQSAAGKTVPAAALAARRIRL